jgi:hypothetical protein
MIIHSGRIGVQSHQACWNVNRRCQLWRAWIDTLSARQVNLLFLLARGLLYDQAADSDDVQARPLVRVALIICYVQS